MVQTPTFIGTAWTLEVSLLPSGKVAGYATEATSAMTRAYDDPAYPSQPGFEVPPRVEARLRDMMSRAAVEGIQRV